MPVVMRELSSGNIEWFYIRWQFVAAVNETNSALESIWRRISQAQPIRSTPTFSQVPHFICCYSLDAAMSFSRVRLPSCEEKKSLACAS